jgi:hypothetical protein
MSGDFPRLSLCCNAFGAGVVAAAVQSEAFQLPIEGRAADLQPPGDFRHLPAVMGDGIANQMVASYALKRHDLGN